MYGLSTFDSSIPSMGNSNRYISHIHFTLITPSKLRYPPLHVIVSQPHLLSKTHETKRGCGLERVLENHVIHLKTSRGYRFTKRRSQRIGVIGINQDILELQNSNTRIG